MDYKHINLNELGEQRKIVQKGSKIAMLVPKLLGKLSVKLVLEPITKLTTGQTFEQVKNEAVNLTMQMQEQEANELENQISVGVQNLSDWKEDREYYIGNLAKYREYQLYIEQLSKKRNKLVSSPKRLLVAKNYFLVMKAFKETNKKIKENDKIKQQIEREYQSKKDAYIAKKRQIDSLQAALDNANAELNKMRAEIVAFEVAYNVVPEEPVVNNTPVQMEQEQNVEQPVVPSQVNVEEPVKDETELSRIVLQQAVSTPVSTNELQQQASEMPMFQALNSVPAQTEADRLFLEQMGSFARQGMPMNASANLEAYGLEETKTR